MNYIETIRIDDNVVQNICYHTARMGQNTSATLPSLEQLNPHTSGRVKCRILYDASAIDTIEFLPYTLPTINTLRIVEASDIIYDKKYLDRGGLNDLFAMRGGCDDILISRGGLITDSYFCNVIFRRGEELYTPDTPLLAGTKRQRLIDEGVVRTCRIRRDDVATYDAIHLVNAMIDLADKVCVPTTGVFE